jgi:Domain of unknown function (DUF4864)
MRRIAVLSAAVCLLSVTAAWADEPPSSADEGAIHDVISKQLEAFSAGNGAAAEAFATPGIQEKFSGPDSFMGMVRNAYSALIRPRSKHFDSLAQTPLGLVQKMTIIAADGQVWTAAYTMTLVDGQWRISGCFILKSEAVNA